MNSTIEFPLSYDWDIDYHVNIGWDEIIEAQLLFYKTASISQ
jgi:hypothetical protein